MYFDTPILFIVFNRVEAAQQVFNAIRKQKPTRLYVVADGPRWNAPNDKELCKKTRSIVDQVDWDCKVSTLFHAENLGCRVAVKQGIDWFFSHETEGVILEDDCLPSKYFFAFCAQMLRMYRNRKDVFLVSGTNYLFNNKFFGKNHYLSNMTIIWGWATWKNRWETINWDVDLPISQAEAIQHYNHEYYGTYIYEMMQDQRAGKINSWAIKLVEHSIFNQLKAIGPGKNLITNIGDVGTHTGNGRKSPFEFMKVQKLVTSPNEEISADYDSSFDLASMDSIQVKQVACYSSRKKSIRIRFLTILSTCIQHFIRCFPGIFTKVKNAISYSLDTTEDECILHNVYNKRYDKRVLLSYLTEAFKDHSGLNSHTNIRECIIIGEVLDSLGFNVDVIDYDASVRGLSLSKYDLIIGQGEALEEAFLQDHSSPVIAYCPGCSDSFTNQETLAALDRFRSRHGKFFAKEIRLVRQNWPLQQVYSDGYIVLGNEFVKKSYVNLGVPPEKISNINIFSNPVHGIDIEKKDFAKNKRNFLWFNGVGAIHKGLDLVLEYFVDHEELNLTVCGCLSKEFKRFYNQHLYESKNITYKSFVDIASCEFAEIIVDNVAIINPSVSEGGAASLINVLAEGGLLPIITESCGVDFNGIEIIIQEHSVESIHESIQSYLTYDPAELLRRARNVRKLVTENYTINGYADNVKRIIKNTISSYGNV